VGGGCVRAWPLLGLPMDAPDSAAAGCDEPRGCNGSGGADTIGAGFGSDCCGGGGGGGTVLGFGSVLSELARLPPVRSGRSCRTVFRAPRFLSDCSAVLRSFFTASAGRAVGPSVLAG